MLTKLFKLFAITITIAMLSIIGCSKNNKPKIKIKGSTTVLPITQKAAEIYMKLNKVSISIEGSGSGNGIKALIDGSTNIANSSREMKKKEKGKAESKGIKIKEIAVAFDMIVPVVNPANPIKNLTTVQLKGIYDGSISNWKEVGGKNEKIVIISRDTSSGTYEVWETKIMGKTDIRKDALLQASNGAVAVTVANNKKAIGYIGFGYLSSKLKAINVNNVKPILKNGKSGKYPIARKLYMYINNNKIKSFEQKFIDYILSNAGQKIVKEAGYIPLN